MRYFLLLLVVLLSACSSKQVHIYNQGYSERQIDFLKTQIEAQGYKVQLPQVAIPREFPQTSLAMNPGFNDTSFYQFLNQLLLVQGYGQASEYRFAQGLHFYSKNEIGLYLKNPDYVVVDMPPYLRTQYCKSSIGATIQFTPQGKFHLEYEVAKVEELQVESGQYLFDGKTLDLYSDTLGQISYRLAKEERETPYGLRPADVFKPVKSNHALGSLNCEFLIIYI